MLIRFDMHLKNETWSVCIFKFNVLTLDQYEILQNKWHYVYGLIRTSHLRVIIFSNLELYVHDLNSLMRFETMGHWENIILDWLIASSFYTHLTDHVVHGQFHNCKTITDVIITNSLHAFKNIYSTPFTKTWYT